MFKLIKLATAGALLAAFVIAPALVKPADAKVVINERTKYYSVTGRNGKALFRSIKRRGPKHRMTGHAIATTTTSIKVRDMKFGIRGRNCVVENVNVFVDITYKYPRWRDRRRANADVRKAWDAFEVRVKKHEETHGRISREYARGLEKKLKTLFGRKSRGCKDFGKFSERRLKQAYVAFQKRQYNFDRREGSARSRIRRLQAALQEAR
ncbi:DUF922 domain-containing protein [Ahrensia sp. R2A130]|uniref:DUF922 domain-containing protein n=1 Tax=Ahrensia sp. R2A130 TaxID=744979 RepID=UPI0001E0A42F|nr:DUF922 domain-containing protein [Ahrensia sp. R2A130]EFL90083.1 conserved hypothetical protein [Ahrensia sp. R2A130]